MNKFIVFAVVAIVAQFAENDVSAASESKLEWCCKVVKVHKNTPHRSWGTLTNKGIQQEWGKKGCDALVAEGGNGNKNTNNCNGLLNSNKDWCCSAKDLYKGKKKGGFNWGTPLKPGHYWGDFEVARRVDWNNRNCDSEVGIETEDGENNKC